MVAITMGSDLVAPVPVFLMILVPLVVASGLVAVGRRLAD